MVFEQQLTERLRPTVLKNAILLDRVRNSISDGTINKNLIFAGAPGTGKCVSSGTLINVRDKVTGEVKLIKIIDLLN